MRKVERTKKEVEKKPLLKRAARFLLIQVLCGIVRGMAWFMLGPSILAALSLI